MPDPLSLKTDGDTVLIYRDNLFLYSESRTRPNYCYLDKARGALVYGNVSRRDGWEEVCALQNTNALTHDRYDVVMVASPADTKRIRHVQTTPSFAQKMPCEMSLSEEMQRLAYCELFRMAVADAALNRSRLLPKTGDREYQHVKRGTRYTVTSISLLQMDGPEDMALMVNYHDMKTEQYWTRPVSEFFDGRFRLA